MQPAGEGGEGMEEVAGDKKEGVLSGPPDIEAILSTLSKEELEELVLANLALLTESAVKDLSTGNPTLKILLTRYHGECKTAQGNYTGEMINGLPNGQGSCVEPMNIHFWVTREAEGDYFNGKKDGFIKEPFMMNFLTALYHYENGAHRGPSKMFFTPSDPDAHSSYALSLKLDQICSWGFKDKSKRLGIWTFLRSPNGTCYFQSYLSTIPIKINIIGSVVELYSSSCESGQKHIFTLKQEGASLPKTIGQLF